MSLSEQGRVECCFAVLDRKKKTGGLQSHKHTHVIGRVIAFRDAYPISDFRNYFEIQPSV
jgi:hypothetical protein